MVARGNPHNIQSLDDLPRVRYVNRQRGAGTRILLDYELKQRGISPESVQGYDHEEYTHLAVAVAVASGLADCGLGVRQAATALGLDFVSVGWERYDFVIPMEHAEHPVVHQLLEVLRVKHSTRRSTARTVTTPAKAAPSNTRVKEYTHHDQ